MTAANKFWDWFKANNQSFITLNDQGIDKELKEKLLNDLLEHLHEYCDHLYFEVGGMPGQEQELIITAEGNIDYFEKIEKLINVAPTLENWQFTAFLQPRELDYTSNFEDVELKPLEMWFLPLDSKSDPKSIGLRICIPNYEIAKSSEWLDAAIYKILDTVLGEKAFALDVNHIEIGDLPDDPENEGMIELKELSAFVRWKKAKLAKL